MRIGEETIETPVDNPIAYPLDWRYRMARAAVEVGATGKKLRTMLHDDDAFALAQHLLRRQKHPLKDGEKLAAFDRVAMWRESPAAELIEAFLLAGETYADAAHELGLPTEDMRLYARLYVDIHDIDGKRRPAVLMRLRGTLDGQDEADPVARLRRIALAGGVHAIRRILRVEHPAKEPSLDDMVEAELKRRMHAGELRTGDLVRLQANAIAKQRITQDQEDDDTRWMEGWQYTYKLLGHMAPHIVSQRKSAEQDAATTQSIQDRLKSQKSVTATMLPADGPDRGHEALNAMMKKHFTPRES